MNIRNQKSNVLLKIMLLSVLGVIIGALAFLFMDKSSLENLKIIENDFLSIRQKGNYIKILFSSLLNSSAFLFMLFFLGFSPVSQPFELLVPLYKGLGLGATISQVYVNNGKSGILISLILIIPYALVSFYALFIGTRESLYLSNKLFRLIFINNNGTSIKDDSRLYMVKFLVLESIIAISSAIDCLCSLVYNNL